MYARLASVTAATPSGSVALTYEQYQYLPDDGRRYEIIEGELYATPAPGSFHQTVSRRLQFELMRCLEMPEIAYVFDALCDVLLADTTVIQPDLAIVSLARKSIISARAIEGPPEIVVEIFSPSTRGRDEHLKRSLYAKFGVKEYWLVDPELGQVQALALEGAEYKLRARFDRASTLDSVCFSEVGVKLEPVFRPL